MGSVARMSRPIRYSDYGTFAWLYAGAPCRWQGKIKVRFLEVELRSLERAACDIHGNVVSGYVRTLKAGRSVSPIVVSRTSSGTYYIHDGNHRFEALRSLLHTDALVRVALVAPTFGYGFRWRWFSGYGTYVLEPEELCRIAPAVKTSLNADQRLVPLLSRPLVLVAHPDDETGGCATILQRATDPVVVFMTDGAPLDEFFWGKWGSRDAYGRIRRFEAERALSTLGIRSVHFLEDEVSTKGSFTDQRLHLSLPAALRAVLALVEIQRPGAIVVPAYEGGHPDHDACSFIGSHVGRITGISVYEMPLYHRSVCGQLVSQRFRSCNGSEIAVRLTPAEQRNRNALVSQYSSQADLARFINSAVEYFRPQVEYDYSRPPHEGVVNYEAWGWRISSEEVCRSFGACPLPSLKDVTASSNAFFASELAVPS